MGNAKFSYKITFIMKNRNRKNSFASLMKEDVGLKDPSWGKHLIVKWLLKSRKTFSQEKLRTGQIKVHSNNLNLFKRHPKNSNSHFGRSWQRLFCDTLQKNTNTFWDKIDKHFFKLSESTSPVIFGKWKTNILRIETFEVYSLLLKKYFRNLLIHS